MLKKKYRITSKIIREFCKWNAYQQLRDRYIEEDNHRRAEEYAIKSVEQNQKAWNLVYDIHPSLKGKTIRVFYADKEVRVE